MSFCPSDYVSAIKQRFRSGKRWGFGRGRQARPFRLLNRLIGPELQLKVNCMSGTDPGQNTIRELVLSI